NLMTPGREEGDGEETPDIDTTGGGKHAAMAERIYNALGGAANVTAIDNCTTRLRLQVNDTGAVDQSKIKATGVPGLKVIDDKNIQVIVGTEVQFVADEMSRLHGGGGGSRAVVEQTVEVEEAPKAQAMFAVAQGRLVPITEVSDDVFSEKMMGDGYAVLPTSGEIFSPVSGTISNVFPTKHAVGITTPSGIEVLLHMGLDTVDLGGKPFTVYVTAGQQVGRGQMIAKVDLEAVVAAGKKTDMIVALTNMDKVDKFELVEQKDVQANDIIGELTSK
ncbi:MAG: glucose PTS transporter subunit IIA, partial [Enterococcus hulanensis]